MQLSDIRTEVLNHGFDPIQYGSRINQYINDGQNLDREARELLRV